MEFHPPDTPGSGDLLAVLLESAESFLGRGIGPDARRCADQVLQLATTDDQKIRALELVARSAVLTQDAEAAEASYLRLLELVMDRGDHAAIAGVYSELGELYRRQGNLTAARDALRESLRWSSSKKPGPLRAKALEELGTALRLLGENVEAVDVLKEALRIRETGDDPAALARSCRALGNAVSVNGGLEEALEFHNRALRISESLESRLEEATNLNNVGGVLLRLGRNEDAERIFLRAGKMFEELQEEKMVAYVANNLGVLASYRGDAALAERHLLQALEIRRQSGYKPGQSKSLNNLAHVARMAGREEDAIARADESIAILTELGQTEGLGSSWFARGRACLELERFSDAEHAAAELTALAERSDHLNTECDSRLLRAELLLRRDELEEAKAEASSVYELAVSSDLIRHVAEAARLEGEIHLRCGEQSLAREKLLQAEKIFKDQHAVYYIALTRLSLAKLFSASAAHEAAAERLRSAVEAFARMGNRSLHWQSLMALAECEWRVSRRQARVTLTRAKSLAEEMVRPDLLADVQSLTEDLARETADEGSGGVLAVALPKIARSLRSAPNAAEAIRLLLQTIYEVLEVDCAWFLSIEDVDGSEAEARSSKSGATSRLFSFPDRGPSLPDAEAVLDLTDVDEAGQAIEVDGCRTLAVAVLGRNDFQWGALAVVVDDPSSGLSRPLLEAAAPFLGFALDGRVALLPSESGPGDGSEADTDAETGPSHGVIGTSSQILSILQTVRSVASSEASILITGESGTGKELIARAIHDQSRRSRETFAAIACPSIPRDLIEAELFGHEKGAFTGADRDRIGRVELADKGTLFLDEIGDIDPATQSKLLRFLQEREFTRVGGRTTLSVDVRIVAATSRNLEEEIRQGRFREDLYYRLNVVPIHVPPLRDRGEDCILIAQSLLDRLSSAANKSLSFAPAALEVIRKSPWPGNVRELRNLVEYLVAVSSGGRIGSSDLPEKLRELAHSSRGTPVEEELRPGETLDARLMSLEGQLIRHALEQSSWNQSGAARLLGITESKLRHRMRRYGLKSPQEARRPRRNRDTKL